jgi:hypothetical protein
MYSRITLQPQELTGVRQVTRLQYWYELRIKCKAYSWKSLYRKSTVIFKLLYFYSDGDRMEIYCGPSIQSICVSWPKVKLGWKENGRDFVMKYSERKILFMSYHLPPTSVAKSKTASLRAWALTALPSTHTWRGCFAERYCSDSHDNASLDYRLPSDCARSLG